LFFPKLTDIATRDVITVSEQASVDEAVRIMRDHNIRDVIVIGELGLRIITAKELVKFSAQGIAFTQKLNQVGLSNVPTISQSASAIDAITLLTEHDDEHLCLLNVTGELVGIVSYSDLAASLDPQCLAQNKSLRQVVRLSRIVRVHVNDTLKQAFKKLAPLNRSEALVLADSEIHPVGIITQSDLIRLFDEKVDWHSRVGEHINGPLITLPESMSLHDALMFSREKHIKRLVVVDENQRICGILHQKDLVALVYHDWSELQKKALIAEKAKNQFLANMSHEIRTPMNAIIGLTELIDEPCLSVDTRKKIQHIQLAAKGLMSVLNDILDFTRLETTELELEEDEFALSEIVESLKGLFTYAAQAKQLEFKIELDPLLQHYYLGDKFRINQVLTNLVGNAIKFTEQGYVRLKVTLDAMKNNQVWLCFEVQDSGIGITEDHKTKLFQPFSQADGSINRKYGGSGLGLAISQRLVKRLGGTGIELLSQEAKGSRFRFCIPLEHSDSPKATHMKRPSSKKDKRELSGCVMLVEDNEINQQILTAQLEGFGLDVLHASSGEQAIAMFNNQPLDLVLMDIQMPGIDGYEAAAFIHQQLPNLPIIALTASSSSEGKYRSKESGMADHLTKPIDKELLAFTLSRWLKRSSTQESTMPLLASQQQRPKAIEFAENGYGYINYQKGLYNLEGNRELYFSLLISFSHQFDSTYSNLVSGLKTLSTSLSSKNLDMASLKRHTHSLKSSAANLGLDSLADCSRILDEILSQHRIPNQQQVEQFKNLIVATRDEINRLIASSPEVPDEVEFDYRALISLLAEIKVALDASEYISQDKLVELTRLLKASPYQANTQGIRLAIIEFDFKTAHHLIDELEQEILHAQQHKYKEDNDGL
jgi:signal transduction histidine kinase/CheY-like chemotaxis protein